jgi:hypothetical protein
MLIEARLAAHERTPVRGRQYRPSGPENSGMRIFDGVLFHLYKEGIITLDEAFENTDSPNNLRLHVTLSE